MESLIAVSAEAAFSAAAITSGVGMLGSVELGFFRIPLDDYDRTAFDSIYDLSSVQGNIIRRNSEYAPHVHVVFNDTTHKTYSGHLIEAVCHITAEIFLSTSSLALRRIKVPECPATKIVRLADTTR